MLIRILVIILILLILAYAIMHINRILKNRYNYKTSVNTYAIQNLETNMDIRVYNAEVQDNTKIISYTHHNWQCMTWQMISVGENLYLLKNTYTNKTFEPTEIKENSILVQKPLEANEKQYYKFYKNEDGTYLIELNNTGLYLTVAGKGKNSNIILKKSNNSDTQKWRLVEQHPIV